MTDTDLIDFYIRAFNDSVRAGGMSRDAIFGGVYIGVFDLRRPITREVIVEKVARHIAQKTKERLTK